MNVMAQYYPEHKAIGHDKIGRRINREELQAALQIFIDKGLTRLDHRYEQYYKCMFDKMQQLFQRDMDW